MTDVTNVSQALTAMTKLLDVGHANVTILEQRMRTRLVMSQLGNACATRISMGVNAQSAARDILVNRFAASARATREV